MNSNEFYADRLIWQFRKSGGAGQYTKTFTDLDAEQRLMLKQRISLADDEIPVLVCFLDADNWVLLTTERLVSCNNGVVSSLAAREIRDATVDQTALREAVGQGKKALRTLTVVSSTGTRSRINLEAGAPFSGFWNALKTVAATNRADPYQA